MTTRLTIAIALGLASAMPATAFAGMGKVFPTYHPAPCSGDDCRADDPRSNKDCAGLLCTFSSAKAMQPPVTAAQAAEADKARVVAGAPPEPVAPAAVPAKRKAKRMVRIKTAPVTTTPTATAPAPAAEAAR